MVLKWLFFLKKFAKNSPPGPHTCHHVQNVKNVQNVIQVALKWQFFFQKKLLELPPCLRASPPSPIHAILFKMSSKWRYNRCFFFQKKVSRIAQRLGASLFSIVVTCSLAHNLHNQQLSESFYRGFE